MASSCARTGSNASLRKVMTEMRSVSLPAATRSVSPTASTPTSPATRWAAAVRSVVAPGWMPTTTTGRSPTNGVPSGPRISPRAAGSRTVWNVSPSTRRLCTAAGVQSTSHTGSPSPDASSTSATSVSYVQVRAGSSCQVTAMVAATRRGPSSSPTGGGTVRIDVISALTGLPAAPEPSPAVMARALAFTSPLVSTNLTFDSVPPCQAAAYASAAWAAGSLAFTPGRAVSSSGASTPNHTAAAMTPTRTTSPPPMSAPRLVNPTPFLPSGPRNLVRRPDDGMGLSVPTGARSDDGGRAEAYGPAHREPHDRGADPCPDCTRYPEPRPPTGSSR